MDIIVGLLKIHEKKKSICHDFYNNHLQLIWNITQKVLRDKRYIYNVGVLMSAVSIGQWSFSNIRHDIKPYNEKMWIYIYIHMKEFQSKRQHHMLYIYKIHVFNQNANTVCCPPIHMYMKTCCLCVRDCHIIKNPSL